MTPLEKEIHILYLVDSRADEVVKKCGSVKHAIEYLKQEQKEFESLWSMYSSECLAHGIKCNRLLISYLEKVL